ncbi:excreted virulence factor EspC (type VII ESX diderm) [Rhodococcus sp. OK519]|uniref:type VII secretion target n=1 Tax=Rhodococcus sp. OK519 TaxID=2135729 RepID=UPI000D3C35A0|nr:excreted virulence factor EspC (type VII ESX diderm) [Rhodococcus sp. OK519]
MGEFSAHTAGIAAFGATAATLAARVETAGAGAAAAGPVLLGPAFGLIGGTFVAAFATAQSAHVTELGHLASAWSGMSEAAANTAAAYDTTDAGNADTLTAAVSGLS